jgi:tRNA A-37 threonylcarbamoyl transferase component Bud32
VRAKSLYSVLDRAMRNLKDGIRSLVKIDFYGHVHKYFRGTDADKRAANEAHILKILEERNCPNVPRLLSYTAEENYIVTTNCGSPAPDLSKKKSNTLFAKLEAEYGVIHDDPEPRNITYSEIMGEFNIIDFELATVIEDFERNSE